MLTAASEERSSRPGHALAARGWRAWGGVLVWLLPALVTLVVGRWGMDSVGIDRDESATIDISTRSIPDIWRMLHHADVVHALYYGFMHYWIGWFGPGALSIRTPSLIGSAVAAALLAVLGTMLVSRRAGLLAGLLFACAPMVSSYAHDARSYGLDSALVIALVLLFVAALRSPRRRLWVAYGAMLVVTVTMHLFTLLLLPAHGVTAAWYARTRGSWAPLRRWIVAAALAFAALVPFVHEAVAQGGTANWIPALTWSAVGTFVVDLSGGVYLIGPLLALAVGAALVRVRSPAGGGHGPVPGVFAVAVPWLVIPPILMFVGSIWDPLYVFRYLLYCLPALMLLAGATLSRLRPAIAVPVLAVLVALTYPMHRSVRDPGNGANDLRGEAAYLEKYARPGDSIVYLIPTQREMRSSYPSAYADLRDPALRESAARAANFSGIDVSDATLEQRLGSVDRLWAVVYWVTASARPAAHVVEARRYAIFKAAGLTWVSTRHFRGGAILHYVRRPG